MYEIRIVHFVTKELIFDLGENNSILPAKDSFIVLQGTKYQVTNHYFYLQKGVIEVNVNKLY